MNTRGAFCHSHLSYFYYEPCWWKNIYTYIKSLKKKLLINIVCNIISYYVMISSNNEFIDIEENIKCGCNVVFHILYSRDSEL